MPINFVDAVVVDAVLRRRKQTILPAETENVPGIGQCSALDRAVQDLDRFLPQSRCLVELHSPGAGGIGLLKLAAFSGTPSFLAALSPASFYRRSPLAHYRHVLPRSPGWPSSGGNGCRTSCAPKRPARRAACPAPLPYSPSREESARWTCCNCSARRRARCWLKCCRTPPKGCRTV